MRQPEAVERKEEIFASSEMQPEVIAFPRRKGASRIAPVNVQGLLPRFAEQLATDRLASR
jgi:hypothetical protein